MLEVLLTQFIPTYPRFKPAGILAALLFPQHQHSIDGKEVTVPRFSPMMKMEQTQQSIETDLSWN